MKKLPENVSAGCSSKPKSEVSNVDNLTDKEILVPNTPKGQTKQILPEAGLNKAQPENICNFQMFFKLKLRNLDFV